MVSPNRCSELSCGDPCVVSRDQDGAKIAAGRKGPFLPNRALAANLEQARVLPLCLAWGFNPELMERGIAEIEAADMPAAASLEARHQRAVTASVNCARIDDWASCDPVG